MTLVERWTALSGRERALVAGALLIAVLVVLRYGGLGGEETGESSSDAPWVQLAKIENYRNVLARSAAIDKQTAEIEARLKAQQERLTAGATATQVAAELQGAVSGMASEAGLNVLSSQILKEEEFEGSKRIGVRLTLSGELSGVAKLVAAVEGGQKDLVISHLEINRKLGASRKPTTSKSQPDISQPPLTVSIEVKTFMRQAA